MQVKRGLIGMVAGVVLALCASGWAWGQGEEPAGIRDVKLDTALRQIIGKQGGVLTVADLQGILGELNLSDRGIADLTGLGSACSVERLVLDGNPVKDLAPLVGMDSLVALSVNNVPVPSEALARIGELPRLSELHLIRADVDDKGLEHIGKATGLEILDVQLCTRMTDEGVRHLAGLTRLKDLRFGCGLDGPGITDEGLAAIGDLSRLEALNISLTRAGDATLARLEDSGNLRYLWAGRTQITDAGLRHLERCTQLDSLGLEDTAVTDAGLQSVGKITSLGWLELSRTAVTDAGLAHLSGLANLGQLHLASTSVTGSGLGALPVCPRLVVVDLADTPTTDNAIAQLAVHPNLWILKLNGTRVTDAGIAALPVFPALQEVNLAGTQVTDRGMEALAVVPDLQRLDISSTAVTETGLRTLMDCPRLQSVTMTDTLTSDAEQERLVALLPKPLTGPVGAGATPREDPRPAVDRRETLALAAQLHTIGAGYASKGDITRAALNLENALAIRREQAPDSQGLGETLVALSLLEHSQGRLDKALGHSLEALRVYEQVKPADGLVAEGVNAVGMIYYARGDLEQARTYFGRAIRLYGQTGTARAMVENNLGVVAYELGDSDAALAHYERASAAWAAADPNATGRAFAKTNAALVRLGRGETAQAREGLVEAVSLLRASSPGSVPYAMALTYLAEADLAAGNAEAAGTGLTEALKILEGLAPYSAETARCRQAVGKVAEASGDPTAAAESYRKSVELLERARAKSSVETAGRGDFLSRHTDVYGDLIRVLVASGKTEEAADTAERMRARSLLEALAERGVQSAKADPDLLEQQSALAARRDVLNDELWGLGGAAPSGARAEEIRTDLASIALEEEILIRQMRAADPSYAAVVYPQPKPVSEIRAGLRPNTLVLCYAVGPDETWVFAYGDGVELRAERIAVAREDLLAKTSDWLEAIVTNGSSEASGGALSELLLTAVRDLLIPGRRLVVMPDGPLWQLPFPALPVGDQVLVDMAPVRYALSGTLDLQQRQLAGRASPTKSGLVIGDVDFSFLLSPSATSGEPVRAVAFRAIESTERGMALKRLPFSGIEAAVVAEALGAETEPLLGVLGSEKAVRDGAAGCEYLHLATHGLLDPSSPLDSAVVLAAPDADAAPENDGFLKARDLMQLDLSACKLVALSACESAKGRVLSGEGVRGLSQAALTAGARSVLCTQWSVYDDSTAALMARFYTHIAAGLARDEALALAMREIRTGVSADGSELQLPDAIGAWQPAWASPVHWAPFALIGEAE